MPHPTDNKNLPARLIAVACIASLTACGPGGQRDASPAVSAAPGPAATASTNGAPVAVSDAVTATGAEQDVDVLRNDSDPDGDSLKIMLVGAPANGSAAVFDAGTPDDPTDDRVRYTPEPGYAGADEFTYTVVDDGGASAVAMVTVYTADIAKDKTAATTVNTPVAIAVGGPGIDAVLSVSAPSFGSVSIDRNGTPDDPADDRLIYVPASGYAGADAFTYTVRGAAGDDTAGVTVTIHPAAAVVSDANLAGQVMKGPVRGALVRLYELGLDGSRIGVPVAVATTDALGRWAATVPEPRTPLLVIAGGGRYDDETRTTGSARTVELTPDDKLIAVALASDAYVVNSVYTYAHYLRARHAGGVTGFADAYATVRAGATASWGLDLTVTEAANPSAPDRFASVDARRHALALGGAANALERIVAGLGLSRPDGPTLRALARDLSDCTLDGRDHAGRIEVEIGGTPQPIVDRLDLNLEILRFRNNRASAFGDTPMPQWQTPLCLAPSPPVDAQAPRVGVDFRRTSDRSPELRGSIDDAFARVEVVVDGTRYPAINLGSVWQLPAGVLAPLADGVYDVRVEATDAGGNIGFDVSLSDLVVDATAPVLTATATAATAGSPALSGTVDDPTAAVTVTIDGSTYAADVSGATWTVPAGRIAPALADGVYALRIDATDGFGNTGELHLTNGLTVSANTPPSFRLSGDLVVDEDFTGARAINATPDPVPPAEAAQRVTWRLQPATSDLADVTISPVTGRVTALALPDRAGSERFTVIADDGETTANVAVQSFLLTVNPVNDAPEFALSGDVVEPVDFAGTRTVTVTPAPVPSDELGQTVSYRLEPAAVAFADLSIDAATGEVSVRALPGRSGAQIVSVVADDGQGVNATATRSFLLSVGTGGAPNATPVITGQRVLRIDEDTFRTLDLTDLTVDDPDSTWPTDFTLSVLPGSGYTVAGSTITPAANFAGTLAVPVTVFDGHTASAAFTLDVIVDPVNDAPAFSVSGDVVADEDFIGTRSVTVIPAAVPTDELAQTVPYTLAPASVPFVDVAFDPASGRVDVTAVDDASGSQVFTLTADDGAATDNTASATFTVTVGAVGDPPTAQPIGDITALDNLAVDVVDLFSAFDDVETDDEELSFTVVGNTDPTLFDSLVIDMATGELALDYATGVRGTTTLTVRATDEDGQIGQVSFDVTLAPQSDLTIAGLAVSDPSPGYGTEVTFTLTVRNDGPSEAAGVDVDLTLPAGYAYRTDDAGGDFDPGTGVWSIAQLAASATLIVTADVQPSGPYEVQAEIAAQLGDDPDSVPANANPAEDDFASVTTAPLPITDLSLSAIVSDPIPAPGDSLTLTVTLENDGPADATGVAVSLPPVPGEFTYEGYAASHGSFDLASGQWTGADLGWSGDPDAPLAATLTVTLRLDASVPLSAVVTASADLTAIDQVEADGSEGDEAVMLVLGNGLQHTWIGGAAPDPTDWHDPDNWASAIVPTPGDEAIIPATANDPVLNADALSLARLDIDTGAQVAANGYTISIRGALDARDGPVTGPGLVRLEWGTLRGTVPKLDIEAISDAAEVDFDDDVTVNGTLTIAKGVLDVRNHDVTVNGDLVSTGTGILRQNDDASNIYVNGDAVFDGGDYSVFIDGQAALRKGDLHIRGNFTQTGHPHSFAAELRHRVIFDGPGPQSIYMQNPDNSNADQDLPAASGSRFARLRIDKHAPVDGPVTLLSDVAVLRKLLHNGNGIARIDAAPGSGHALIVGGVNVDPAPFPFTHNLVFDNVPLRVVDGATINDFNGMVFRNMDPSVVQLTVARDEDTPTMKFYGLRFETLPDTAAGGHYIELRNADVAPASGVRLEIYQSEPAFGWPLSRTVGMASLYWGWYGYDTDGDGLQDEDEYAAGTNPVFADSDFDGLSDPDELSGPTDAMLADTDGDGVGDATEMAAGSDPTTPAAPGTVLYVRPAPFGDDANTGTGGWADALATNAAVEAALFDGASASQPTLVLYDAGSYAPLEIRDHTHVSLVGSLGPGRTVPDAVPSTVFDAGSTPNVAVIDVRNGDNVRLQSLALRGARNYGSGTGGGLRVDALSSVTAAALHIEDNEAQSAGGGAYLAAGGALTIERSLIRRNVAYGAGGAGIAAYGQLAVADTTLADNRYLGGDATGGGGALLAVPGGGPVVVRDSRMLGNYSATHGGAVRLYDVNAATTLHNNLVVGNVADGGEGGGLSADRLDNGAFTLIASNTVAMNSLLTRNDAAGGFQLRSAANAQLRDNIAWYNRDADAVGELADQLLTDGTLGSLIYNALEDFGGTDGFGNHGSDPKFEFGFYLDGGSPSVNSGSMNASTAGLDAPYMTNAAGYTDAGTLNRGYHFVRPAEGVPYEAYLVGETVECAADRYTARLVVAGYGGDLGAGHAVAARLDGSDTGGGSVQTLAPLEPFGWSGARLAIDEGDGVYRVAVDGVAWGAGQRSVLELRIDDGATFTLSSTDLTTLFGDAGC